MRGNPASDARYGESGGSIPAYAGEPRADLGSAFWVDGLSPRMRGNHTPARRPASGTGSIPAYAGEPAAYQQGAGVGEVYPRVCGGTDRWSLI